MTRAGAFALCVFLAAGAPVGAARADAGHDHAAPAAGIPVANAARVEAQSDLFEIVGVVEGDALKIFLDRYATNEPVTDARIDIEAGELRGPAQPISNGTYAFRNAAFTRPGQFPVTFTITAGNDSDLLAGDLVISDPAAVAPQTRDAWWARRWWWAGAGLIVVLAGIAVAWWSLRKRVKGTTS
jgi:hypothetical protein